MQGHDVVMKSTQYMNGLAFHRIVIIIKILPSQVHAKYVIYIEKHMKLSNRMAIMERWLHPSYRLNFIWWK